MHLTAPAVSLTQWSVVSTGQWRVSPIIEHSSLGANGPRALMGQQVGVSLAIDGTGGGSGHCHSVRIFLFYFLMGVGIGGGPLLITAKPVFRC